VATGEGEPRLREVLHGERHMRKALQHKIAAEASRCRGSLWLGCGGDALVMRRHRRRVDELHHTEVVLLGLHTGENEAVSVMSTVVVAAESRAPTRVGLPAKKSGGDSVDRR
jgi:hypothetical protein